MYIEELSCRLIEGNSCRLIRKMIKLPLQHIMTSTGTEMVNDQGQLQASGKVSSFFNPHFFSLRLIVNYHS